MADFVSAPQVVDENDIILYGNHYKLAAPIQVIMHTTPPPKIRIGEHGHEDDPRVASYHWHDLRGGKGLWQIADLSADNNRTWHTENMNLLWVHQLGMGPTATNFAAPGAVGAAVGTNVIIRLNTNSGNPVVGFDDGRLFTYTGAAWSALIDTLPGASIIYDAIVYTGSVSGKAIFYALGANGYSYQTDVTAVATDSTAIRPVAFAQYDGALWALGDTGILYSTTTGTTWSTFAALPNTSGTPALCTYRDPDGDAALWAVSEHAAYFYDKATNVWHNSGTAFGPYVKSGTYGYQRMQVFRDRLYIQMSDSSLFEFYCTGGSIVIRDVSPGLPDGMEFAGSIHSMAADNDLLYLTYSSGGQRTVLVYNTLGWTCIYSDEAAGGATPHPIAIIYSAPTSSQRELWVGNNLGNGSVPRFKIIDLEDGLVSPLLGAAEVTTSGLFQLPYFGGSIHGKKLALRLIARAARASASDTIQFAYRVDGSTGGFTNVGSALTGTTETSLWFGTNNVGVSFDSIQLQATYTNGAAGGEGPVLEYVTLKYMDLPEALRGFILDLDMTRDYMGVSPRVMIENLWTTLGRATLGTFGYHDDAGNTRSYLVHAERPEGLENTTTGNEQGKYRVLLLAMRDND